MNIPEKPPQTLKEISAFKLFGVPGTRELAQKANNAYMPWEEFKYEKFPEGVTAIEAWAYIKTIRSIERKLLFLKDNEGAFFNYWLPSSFHEELHYIDQNAGGLILAEDPLIHQTEKERYIISSLMEEAIASSQLEGASTERKIAKELLRSGRKPKNTSEHMIVNNFLTIKEIKKHLDEPLTPELLKKIQASITQNTLDMPDGSGRFRQGDEEVQIVDDRDGKTLFVPCPNQDVEKCIEELCEYANDVTGEFTHPVIKAIILHFLLAYIHPFIDGNGRTARTLFYWYVLKNKYWMFEYLAISKIILEAKSRYARAFLYTETDEADLTYFIHYHLRVIKDAINALKNYMTIKQSENAESLKLLRIHPGINNKQQQILRHALSHPFTSFSIEYYKNLLGVAYETARSSLSALVEEGLLISSKEGKAFLYQASPDIAKKLKKK
jgi:Fic family protein